ncbi:hypothetical protein BS78_10G091500 [Paspalum vaginatum]|nr:hypothetical protein BS78_10G091500 [Paspalum vaginatum]
MKLATGLATITALFMHHLVLTAVAAIAHHTTAPNTSLAGLSLPLVAGHEGPDHTLRRGSDGFLYLRHNPRTEILPHSSSSSSPSSSSAANVVTTPHPETSVTPLRLPQSLVVGFGTGSGKQNYLLKVDASSSLTWLQCKGCDPHAPQRHPLFDPLASPTSRSVPGTDSFCRPPFWSVLGGILCAFHVTSPRGMSVEGYLAADTLTHDNHEHRNVPFGCAHKSVNFQSEGVFAGVVGVSRAPASLATQLATRGLARFSYCLFAGGGDTNRHGFLRFGADVPRGPRYVTTSILPALDPGESGFFVGVVGVSLGARRLDGIRPEMFARREDGQGGCVVDLGAPLTVMVREAYDVVEEAVWSDLRRHGAERVRRPEYGLCVRASEAVKGRLQSLSLHFPEEKAVLVFSPRQLFLMLDDKQQGQIACLAMVPGRRTVIGAFQQMDTRFVFDLEDSKLSFASESCIQDTIEVA